MNQTYPDPGDPEVVAKIIKRQQSLTREQWQERLARIPGILVEEDAQKTVLQSIALQSSATAPNETYSESVATKVVKPSRRHNKMASR